jgi:hypothetical protein
LAWRCCSFQKAGSESKSKWKLSAIILLIWFVLNIATIIIKSYTGDASILTRYFIGVLPAFILAAAFVLSLIPNKIVRLSAVGILVAFSLYNLIVDKIITIPLTRHSTTSLRQKSYGSIQTITKSFLLTDGC